MTPSAESQSLSSSFPHTLVSVAVLHFQPDPGQAGVQLVAGVQTSRSLGQGCPLHSLEGAPSALNLHPITRSVSILWETVPHLYLCSMAKTSPCMRAPVYPQTSPSPGWSLDTTSVTGLLLSEVRVFAIVPLHSAPADAVSEIDALYDVYLDVQQKWGLEVRPCSGQWGLLALFVPGPTGVSPGRTSCSWEISMLAAATSLPPNGLPFAFGQAPSSSG